MAFKLKGNSCTKDNCTIITVNDTSGLYSSTNTTGYETPNIRRINVLTAIVSLTINGETLDYNVLSNLTGATTSVVELVNINIADFGLTVIPNGLYDLEYTITSESETYTTKFKGLALCQAQCCIDNRFKQFPDKLAACCNQCEEAEYIKDTYIGQALIDGLWYAFKCGNYNVITKNLNRINRICLNLDCGCS